MRGVREEGRGEGGREGGREGGTARTYIVTILFLF